MRYLGYLLRFACGKVESIPLREGFTPRCHPLCKEYFEVFREDSTQIDELDAFIEHCTPGLKLLDIGAHHGFFALAATHFGGPHAEVVCVEASSAAVKILRSNLAINNVDHQVHVICAAMGGEDGELQVLTTGPFGGDYFVPAPAGRRDATTIATKTMETVLDECEFAPTHVKIDIEGFEYEVIHNARDVLLKLRPILFLELHGSMMSARGCNPSRVIGDLRECGYSRFMVGSTDLNAGDLERANHDCRLICLPRSTP